MADPHRPDRVQLHHSFQRFEKQAIDQSIPGRFAEMVRQYPDRTAVTTAQLTLRYDELDRLSNRISNAILNRSVNQSAAVALMLPQGAANVAAILAVLKAGKIYVPLDTAFDDARLKEVLDDAESSIIVADRSSLDLARRINRGRGAIIEVDSLPAGLSDAVPRVAIDANAYAYIFYTSGSTGKPKGVVDTHRNVLHNIMRYTNSLHVTPDDRFTLLQAPHFSGSVSSLFTPLLNGAAVCPMNLRIEDMTGIGDLLRQNEITIYHSVPSLFRLAMDDPGPFPHLRIVRIEGDQMSKRDLEIFRERCPKSSVLVNGLGATECGIVRQHFMNSESTVDGSVVPIGNAVEDMEMLLLDESDQPVEPGEVGQIVIRSAYMAKYWKRPDLNESFFRADPEHPELRLYHTGDLGRCGPYESIEFLGRSNFRLKIRGQWVDASEVESALSSLAEVDAAAVATFRDDQDELRLAAYVVASGQVRPKADSLRRQLLNSVQPLLVPSAFVFLDALPLDVHGKLDRKSLPTPKIDRPSGRRPIVRPSSDLKTVIASIWCDVLELESVGGDENFFALGGDSLHLVRVLARLQEALSSQISMISLFEHPTVHTLAAHLDSGSHTTAELGQKIVTNPRMELR